MIRRPHRSFGPVPPVRSALHVLLLLVVGAVVAACSTAYPPTRIPTPEPTLAPSTAPGSAPTCENPLRSYAPPKTNPAAGSMPSGSTMAAIAKRGRLIAGVSADTYLLGSRNPTTGQIEGFDIDLVKALAKAILGDENKYELKVITASQRIDVLDKGEVDVVARNMTINCARWQDIAFSAEYYRSGAKVLVRRDAGLDSVAKLRGRKVCAPTGTSSLTVITEKIPGAEAVPAANHTGCLILFQTGAVDAIVGDDTVLAGLVAQDPYAEVLEMEPLSAEPYGLGFNARQTDLVRFTNRMLADRISDGDWKRSYDRWLAPSLGAGSPPSPEYGR